MSEECLNVCPTQHAHHWRSKVTIRPLYVPMTIYGFIFENFNLSKGILDHMSPRVWRKDWCITCFLQALGKMLDARQLGLKMITNVTYGYTAASFSGRMPCVEIADSIVQKGRETLERAIQLVNSTPEWRARVVYGDTDRWVDGVSVYEYHYTPFGSTACLCCWRVHLRRKHFELGEKLRREWQPWTPNPWNSSLKRSDIPSAASEFEHLVRLCG